jgi:hypothetical protein
VKPPTLSQVPGLDASLPRAAHLYAGTPRYMTLRAQYGTELPAPLSLNNCSLVYTVRSDAPYMYLCSLR